MKILLDFQKGMRAVTLNSEFSLCGLISVYVYTTVTESTVLPLALEDKKIKFAWPHSEVTYQSLPPRISVVPSNAM